MSMIVSIWLVKIMEKARLLDSLEKEIFYRHSCTLIFNPYSYTLIP
jgi:hypothetical protein